MKLSSAARLGLLCVALCASVTTSAEYPIDIKTGLKGKYYVVEKGGSADYPTLVVKNEWFSGGPIYTKRAFDCKNHSLQVLGSGVTLEEMAKAKPEPQSYPVKEGSIGAQLWRHACYGK